MLAPVEQRYDAETLAAEIEAAIRRCWRLMHQYRREAANRSAPFSYRRGCERLERSYRGRLLMLLGIRRAARRR